MLTPTVIRTLCIRIKVNQPATILMNRKHILKNYMHDYLMNKPIHILYNIQSRISIKHELDKGCAMS